MLPTQGLGLGHFTSGAPPTISSPAISPASVTQAESATVTCTSETGNTLTLYIDDKAYVMGGGAAGAFTYTLYGRNFATGSYSIKLVAENDGGLIITDESLSLTVTATTDEIKYILNEIATEIADDVAFSAFDGRIHKTGAWPSADNQKATPPLVVLELRDGDPRKRPLYSEGGIFKRIEYLTVRIHLIYRRDHKKTVDSVLYEGTELSNWYKKELQSCLEQMRFAALNIDDIQISGTAYSEEADTTMLYGCVFDLTLGYQTLEA